MEQDKLFLIYQFLVMSEADRLNLLDHDIYRDAIKSMADSMIKYISETTTKQL